MKKTRSLILVGAAVALAAVLAIGSSLAYYSDRDAKTNVFTTGNVEIDLVEDFVQESQLMPGVDINKDVWITNTGDNDAFVFYTYAVPAVLDGILHVEHSDDPVWDCTDGKIATKVVNGVEYNVYSVLYQDPLEPGESTPIGMTNVCLDSRVDYNRHSGEYYLVDGDTRTVLDGAAEVLRNFPKILVNAYGIQTDTFDTVREAYAAYIGQWGELQVREAHPTP